MITEEQRTLIVLYRLEGLPVDWCVYWAMKYAPAQSHKYLGECREHPEYWDYFRRETCNLLEREMVEALKELQG